MGYLSRRLGLELRSAVRAERLGRQRTQRSGVQKRPRARTVLSSREGGRLDGPIRRQGKTRCTSPVGTTRTRSATWAPRPAMGERHSEKRRARWSLLRGPLRPDEAGIIYTMSRRRGSILSCGRSQTPQLHRKVALTDWRTFLRDTTLHRTRWGGEGACSVKGPTLFLVSPLFPRHRCVFRERRNRLRCRNSSGGRTSNRGLLLKKGFPSPTRIAGRAAPRKHCESLT